MSLANRSVLTLVLIALLALSAGCRSAAPEGMPMLPRDPLERTPVTVPDSTAHWQGEIVGEVTRHSFILQARLTLDGKVRRTDVK